MIPHKNKEPPARKKIITPNEVNHWLVIRPKRRSQNPIVPKDDRQIAPPNMASKSKSPVRRSKSPINTPIQLAPLIRFIGLIDADRFSKSLKEALSRIPAIIRFNNTRNKRQFQQVLSSTLVNTLFFPNNFI
jgi:hypothetical protein